MKYIPFGASLEKVPNIMVDSTRNSSTVLELSHWPANKTPNDLKADSSTEIVLNYLKKSKYFEQYKYVNAVSNDHYDIDGLLSLWSIINPKESLEISPLLIETSETGDFDIFTSEIGLKTCITINKLHDNLLQPIIANSKMNSEQITTFLYNELLQKVPECLYSLDKFQYKYNEEYTKVMTSIEILTAEKNIKIDIPEIDLSIICCKDNLHEYAINYLSPHYRVLNVRPGNIYTLKYRYETFVDYKSKKVPHRIRLNGLVDQLNSIEKNQGKWFCENIISAHPQLQLYTKYGAPSPSSIPENKFINLVVEYLKKAEKFSELKWHSSDGWIDLDNIPLPPSMQKI